MKKLIYALSALILVLGAACTKYEARTLEQPFVSAVSTTAVDIAEVDLNDSTTVVKLKVKFTPGYWIRFAKETYLVADGKEYAVRSSEGIELDSLFTMPESGEAEFTFTFEPLPFTARTMDFVEKVDDGYALYGIDLTDKGFDKKQFTSALPREVKNAENAEVDYEPVLEVAESELRFHFVGYRPEYGSKFELAIEPSASSETMTVDLDEKGEATLKTTLIGTTELTMSSGSSGEVVSIPVSVLVAPGENTDIYISPAVFAELYSRHMRGVENLCDFDYVRTNGKYAALNAQLAGVGNFNLSRAAYEKYNWRMSNDEYTATVVAVRDSLLGAIAASDMSENLRSYVAKKVNLEALSELTNAKNNQAYKYVQATNDWDGYRDSVKIEISPENYAQVLSGIDGNDRSCYAIPSGLAALNSVAKKGEVAPEGVIFDELPIYTVALANAHNAALTDADIAQLETLSDSFFADAAKACNEIAFAKFGEAIKQYTADPAVEGMKLFNSIIGAHKGKVVLVDLWNTWCGPCRRALAANEPLKSGELNNEDIVWIYIADESSDKSKYIDMLSDIKGEHHIVSSEQVAAIRKHFEVDGIPYYILVDRAGKAVGHPDFRDHAVMLEGIKSKL